MKMTYVFIFFFTFLLHFISYKVWKTFECVCAGGCEENNIDSYSSIFPAEAYLECSTK